MIAMSSAGEDMIIVFKMLLGILAVACMIKYLLPDNKGE